MKRSRMCHKRLILKEEIWGGKVGENELLRNINRLEITVCISGER